MAPFKCGHCGGRGVVSCKKCRGSGSITVHRPIAPDAKWDKTCDRCGGSGVEQCPNPRCEGGIVRA